MNERLKIKIIKSGQPQIAIAMATGISESRISKIVNWPVATEEEKKKLAEALECEIEEIF